MFKLKFMLSCSIIQEHRRTSYPIARGGHPVRAVFRNRPGAYHKHTTLYTKCVECNGASLFMWWRVACPQMTCDHPTFFARSGGCHGSSARRAPDQRLSARRGRPRAISCAFERESTLADRSARKRQPQPRPARVNLRFRAGGGRGSGVFWRCGERPFDGKAAAHASEPRRIRSARAGSAHLHVSHHASGSLSNESRGLERVGSSGTRGPWLLVAAVAAVTAAVAVASRRRRG